MAKSTLFLCLIGLASMIDAAPAEELTTRALKHKRGLPYNDAAFTKLFKFPGSKISWMYNWDSKTSGAADGFNYVPMLHSDKQEHTGPWQANVAKGVKNGVTHIVSFNEPDQCGAGLGGSCMQNIGQTVAAHKKWVQPMAKKYPQLRIGAPAITNGERDKNSGAKMGIPYLKDFLDGCKDCRIDMVVAHWYDSADHVDYFKDHLKKVHEASGKKPVWLTEFAATSGDAQKFLRAVIPWMDKQPWIMRYSYQWAAKGVLVNDAGNGLTPLGKLYATL